MDIYFNFINYSQNTEECYDILHPLHYKEGNVSSVRAPMPCEELKKEDWMREDPLLKHIQMITPFLRYFPNREIKNIKLSIGDNQYLIMATNFNKLRNWFGLTIILTEKELMPVTAELKLADEIYQLKTANDFCSSMKSSSNEKIKNSIMELIRNYSQKQSLSESLSTTRKARGEKTTLERLIVTDDYKPEWSFFVTSTFGSPITDLLLFEEGGFLIPKMNRELRQAGYSEQTTIDNYLISESAGLSAFYLSCQGFYQQSGFEKASLRHFTYKFNDGGYGFTFFREAEIDGQETILVLNVKNKVNNEYVNAISGKESPILSRIRKELLKARIELHEPVLQRDYSDPVEFEQARREQSNNNEIFSIVKNVIKKEF